MKFFRDSEARPGVTSNPPHSDVTVVAANGTSRQESPQAGRSTTSNADLLLTLGFIAFYLVQLAHHQMWRDELHPWNIVLASPSLASLFAKIHYEAHPSFWYLILWTISRFTSSLMAMKVVQGVTGICIYLMIGLKSPFSRLEKVLLFLSYFVSFEYTVLVRMYGLCLLILLVYLRLRTTRPERLAANMALLGLLANVDMLGLLVSGALALEYGLNRILAWRQKGLREPKRVWAAAAMYVGLVGLSVWTVFPPPRDISWQATGHAFAAAGSLPHLRDAAVNYLVLPWFPIARGFPRHFWNPSAWQHPVRYMALLPLVLAGLAILFWREKVLLIFLASAALVGVSFGHLIYLGFERHFGIVFLAFLAAYWILRSRWRSIPVLGCVFLGLSAVGGVQAAIAQWLHPFSNEGAVAHWVERNGYRDGLLIGWPDYSAEGIGEILRRPMYLLECNCEDPFMFSQRFDAFNFDELPERVQNAVRGLNGRTAILMIVFPLTERQISNIEARGMRTTLLTQFTDAEEERENFFIYSLAPTRRPDSVANAHRSGELVK